MGLDPGKGVEVGKGEKADVQKGGGRVRGSSKGAILGEKGQKLPEGVLLGGKREVGKINERARHNKQKTVEREEKAESKVVEVKEKVEPNVLEVKEKKEAPARTFFGGWF